MLQIFEALDGDYIEHDADVGRRKLLGECDTREQGEMLIGKLPGKGRCYIWDPAQKRKLCLYSWENEVKRGEKSN